jgi:hypothetical protein
MFSTTSFSSMHACISLRFLSLLGPAKLTLKLFVFSKTRGCIVKASCPICLYYPLEAFYLFIYLFWVLVDRLLFTEENNLE